MPDEGGTWDGMALGDSCIFQISGDRLVGAVPISSSADFGTHPPLFYTDQALTERAIGGLVTTHGVWAPGTAS